MNNEDIDQTLPEEREEVKRKLAIIKAVREQQEEKYRIFEELCKKGIPTCIFSDDQFFL